MHKIHGEYSLELSGNIMFIEANGPWNTECVEKFQQDYHQLILPLVGSPWGDLVVLHGESLLIPSAEQLLSKIIAHIKHSGLSHVALVLSNSAVKNSAKIQFIKVYAKTDVNMCFFDSSQQGLNWLIEQGLYCDSDYMLSKLA